MLGLRIDADTPGRRLVARARRMGAHHIGAVHQIQDFIERRNLELTIKARIGRSQVSDALARPQGFQFSKREVFGEPALDGGPIDDLAGATVGELRVEFDIGGSADLILMARDQHPSRVLTRSGSTKSAPCWMARKYDARVCSGA